MPNRTHWNGFSNSGSSTGGPNEPANKLSTGMRNRTKGKLTPGLFHLMSPKEERDCLQNNDWGPGGKVLSKNNSPLLMHSLLMSLYFCPLYGTVLSNRPMLKGEINLLTLNNTIPIFYNIEKKIFRKHCGKRRICWQPAFSPFHKMFPTLPKINFKLSLTFTSILSSADVFSLDKSRNFSFGMELTFFHMHGP